MIIKKVPGAVEVQMVYDLRDRPVFTQDGNERKAHQWLVTYCDLLNRPVETGIYSSTTSQTNLQTMMDGVSGSSSVVTYSVPAPGDLIVNSRSGNTPATYTARSSITFFARLYQRRSRCLLHHPGPERRGELRHPFARGRHQPGPSGSGSFRHPNYIYLL